MTGPATADATIRVRVTTAQGKDASNAAFTISAAPPAPAGWSRAGLGHHAVARRGGLRRRPARLGGRLGRDRSSPRATAAPRGRRRPRGPPRTSGASPSPTPLHRLGRGRLPASSCARPNGGATWTPRAAPGPTWTLDDIDAISATTAVAVGLDGAFKTTDGGPHVEAPDGGARRRRLAVRRRLREPLLRLDGRLERRDLPHERRRRELDEAGVRRRRRPRGGLLHRLAARLGGRRERDRGRHVRRRRDAGSWSACRRARTSTTSPSSAPRSAGSSARTARC